MISTIDKSCEGCHLLPNNSLYIRLYEGTKKFNSLFCLNQEFKKKILTYVTCFNDLREEFIDCEGEGDWYENSNSTSVCDTFKTIIECDYTRTAEECGDEAAFILTCLSKTVFETVLIPKCELPKPKEMEKFEKSEAAKLIEAISSDGASLGVSFIFLAFLLPLAYIF